jgi:hypothetical protein
MMKATDIVHWHGPATDTVSDGAAQEGSPMIVPEPVIASLWLNKIDRCYTSAIFNLGDERDDMSHLVRLF